MYIYAFLGGDLKIVEYFTVSDYPANEEDLEYCVLVDAVHEDWIGRKRWVAETQTWVDVLPTESTMARNSLEFTHIDADGTKHWLDEYVNGKVDKSGDTMTGDLTLNGSDLYTTDIYITENGGAKGQIYGKTPQGEYVPNIQPCNENGNCVIGWGNKNRGVGNTNIYGATDINMTLTGSDYTVFSARNAHNNMQINHSGYVDNNSKTYIYGSDVYLRPTAAEYKPYYAAGDTISVSISTAGYLTSGGTEVCFTLPIAKPIIGNPNIAVTTDGGLVLRQGGKYTHGSSSTVGAYATLFTVGVQAGGNYINIRAKLTDTTNAVNNDAIGISWSGTITLS